MALLFPILWASAEAARPVLGYGPGRRRIVGRESGCRQMEERFHLSNSPILGSIVCIIDALGDLIAKPVYDASVTNPRLADRRNDALWRKTKPALRVLSTAGLYVALLAAFSLVLIDFSALRTPRSCAEQVANARGGGHQMHSHTADSLLLRSRHVELSSACTSGGHTNFLGDKSAIARMRETCRRVTSSELEAGLIILDPYKAHGSASTPRGEGESDPVDSMYEHSYVTIDDAVALNEELLRRSQGVDFMSPKFWKRKEALPISPASDESCQLDRYDDAFNPCMISVRIGAGAGHVLTLINPVVVDSIMEKPHSHASHGSPPPSGPFHTAASAACALEAQRAARPSASEVLVAEFTEPADIFYPLRISEMIYPEPTISAVDARECMAGGEGNVSAVARRIKNWKTAVVLQLATAAVGDSHFLDRGEIMDDPEHEGVVNIVTVIVGQEE